MSERERLVDGPCGTWFKAGEASVLKTADGFQVYIKPEKTGWVARISDIKRNKVALAREVYPSEESLRQKCMEVLDEMRGRKARAAAQGKLL